MKYVKGLTVDACQALGGGAGARLERAPPVSGRKIGKISEEGLERFGDGLDARHDLLGRDRHEGESAVVDLGIVRVEGHAGHEADGHVRTRGPSSSGRRSRRSSGG